MLAMKSLENTQGGEAAPQKNGEETAKGMTRRKFITSASAVAAGVAVLGIEGKIHTAEATDTPIESFKKRYPKLSSDPKMAKFLAENPGINDFEGDPEEVRQGISGYYRGNACNARKIIDVAIPGFAYLHALFLEKEGKQVPDTLDKLVPPLKQQEYYNTAKQYCIERGGKPNGY